MLDIIIASQNEGKIREIKEILCSPGIRLLTYKNFGAWPDVEEVGETFLENALLKAGALVDTFDTAAVADDSGLEVDALAGKPGVLSARYAGPQATDSLNNKKLLEALEGVPEDERTARFRCVAVYLELGGFSLSVQGVLEGRIATEPKGTGGFGYDPIFVPEGKSRTVGEMSLAEKNQVSHRAQAFRKLRVALQERLSSKAD